MAIDTLAPGTTVGQTIRENGIVYQWDGVAWFPCKDNLDNNFEIESESSPAIIDSNGTPTLATGITGQEIRTLIGATDTDTTYRVEATNITGGAGLRLDAAGSGQDTVVDFVAGDHATITRTNANTIQISGAAPTDMGATVQERMSLLAGVGTWTNITGISNLPAGTTLRNIGTDGYFCRVETRNGRPTLVAYTTFTPPSTFSGEYGTFEYSRPQT